MTQVVFHRYLLLALFINIVRWKIKIIKIVTKVFTFSFANCNDANVGDIKTDCTALKTIINLLRSRNRLE